MRTASACLLFVLALGLASCGAPESDKGATSPAGVSVPTVTWRGEGAQLEFSITNMDCSGCASTVKSVLKALDGVNEVTADNKTGLVHITLSDAGQRDALIALIPPALKDHGGKEFEIAVAAP